MKIIELTAENFKRLRAVHIKPDGTLQQITGRNAQGKTSVLDAVWAALAGKDASPARPVRDGADRAKVAVDLGDLVVTRKWSADGKSTVSVESKDGASYKSPQAMLDKLVGTLSFDPLAFVRAPAKQQATTLRGIAGVDTTSLDGRRLKLFDDRTEANRVLKAEQARLGAMPLVEAPDEPVSVAALLDELKRAEATLADRAAVMKRATDSDKDVVACEAAVRAASEAMAIAEDNFVQAQKELEAAKAKHIEDVRVADARSEVIDPDPLEIRDRIGSAEEVNAKVRQRAARAEQVAVTTRASEKADKLTAAIDAIDAEKKTALAAAAFPVPGLSVDDDGPTFNGVPLSQASGAEQLRVGLAVAAALNPKLRTVLVRDGSLLDADGLALVATWAAEHDMQVLMERVADGSGVGIIIEDGMVAEAEAPAVEGVA